MSVCVHGCGCVSVQGKINVSINDEYLFFDRMALVDSDI